MTAAQTTTKHLAVDSDFHSPILKLPLVVPLLLLCEPGFSDSPQALTCPTTSWLRQLSDQFSNPPTPPSVPQLLLYLHKVWFLLTLKIPTVLTMALSFWLTLDWCTGWVKVTYIQATHYLHFMCEKIKPRMTGVNISPHNHTVNEWEGQDWNLGFNPKFKPVFKLF